MNECPHLDTPIRKLVCANGAIQFKRQCQTCWQAVGGAIAHGLVGDKDSVPLFNQEARDNFWKERRERTADESLVPEEQDWEAAGTPPVGYREYLMSPEWQAKRLAVLERANWRCEAGLQGCAGRAEQVHHRTYRHLGDEPLWELAAICFRCHEKFKGTKLDA